MKSVKYSPIRQNQIRSNYITDLQSTYILRGQIRLHIQIQIIILPRPSTKHHFARSSSCCTTVTIVSSSSSSSTAAGAAVTAGITTPLQQILQLRLRHPVSEPAHAGERDDLVLNLGRAGFLDEPDPAESVAGFRVEDLC